MTRAQTYAAQVTFTFRNAAGEREAKTLAQDVTDEIKDGAFAEALVDRIYWNQIVDKFDDVEILSGDVFVVNQTKGA